MRAKTLVCCSSAATIGFSIHGHGVVYACSRDAASVRLLWVVFNAPVSRITGIARNRFGDTQLCRHVQCSMWWYDGIWNATSLWVMFIGCVRFTLQGLR